MKAFLKTVLDFIVLMLIAWFLRFMIKVSIGTEPARTQGAWSGCFETVYVRDPNTNVVRKFTRNEVRATATADSPATGRYGAWIETKPEPPGAKAYYRVKIAGTTQAEVARVLGRRRSLWFSDNTKAQVSRTYNFTNQPFSIIGLKGTINARNR